MKNLGADFFGKPKEAKSKDVLTLGFDLSTLLEITSDDNFLEEIKNALNVLSEDSTINPKRSVLLEVFVNYLNEIIIPLYDKISVRFYVASVEEKKALLEKLFSDNSLCFKMVRNFFSRSTGEEIQKLFGEIVKKGFVNSKTIIIQSAHECLASLKNEIRSHYGKDYFLIFQVNTSLLGGMLIYKDGVIQDSSWLGKISALKNFRRER